MTHTRIRRATKIVSSWRKMWLSRLSSLEVDDVLRTVELDAQQRAAECMRLAGFDYLPVAPPTRTADPIASDFHSFNYAKQFGFGIAAVVLHADLLRFASTPDPNDSYSGSLSTTAKARFDATLHGADAQGGCLGEALVETTKRLGLDDVKSQYVATTTTAESDPRVAAARKAWVTCAQTHAVTSTSCKDLIDSLRQKVPAAPEPGASLTTAQRTAWESFEQVEIAAAVATFDCSQKYDAVYDGAVAELARWG